MTTMREVAAAAGVSAKTVSRVFNADPHVTPETRARVEVALRQLNYVPNAVATTFRTGRSPSSASRCPTSSTRSSRPSRSRWAGSRPSTACPLWSPASARTCREEADVVGRLLSQSLSGLIIAPVAAEHAYLEPWKDRLPIVFVDRRPVRLAADSFTEDDQGGAHMATRHLVDHGHRRIAFVSDTPDLPTSHSRLLGYRAALDEAGIGENPDYEVYGAVDRGSAAGVLRKLMELAEPPTAIMSSNARILDGARARAARPRARHRRVRRLPHGRHARPGDDRDRPGPLRAGHARRAARVRPARAPRAPLPPSHGAARHPRRAGVLPRGRPGPRSPTALRTLSVLFAPRRRGAERRKGCEVGAVSSPGRRPRRRARAAAAARA